MVYLVVTYSNRATKNKISPTAARRYGTSRHGVFLLLFGPSKRARLNFLATFDPRVKEPCVCAARELLTLARKLEEHRIYPA